MKHAKLDELLALPSYEYMNSTVDALKDEARDLREENARLREAAEMGLTAWDWSMPQALSHICGPNTSCDSTCAEFAAWVDGRNKIKSALAVQAPEAKGESGKGPTADELKEAGAILDNWSDYPEPTLAGAGAVFRRALLARKPDSASEIASHNSPDMSHNHDCVSQMRHNDATKDKLGPYGWPWDKRLEDFDVLAQNLVQVGEQSRAEAVRYLIARVKRAESIISRKPAEGQCCDTCGHYQSDNLPCNDPPECIRGSKWIPSEPPKYSYSADGKTVVLLNMPSLNPAKEAKP